MVEPVTNTSEAKGRFLLELYRKALTLPENELYEYFLDHAVEVTKSNIGFFHQVTDNQKTIVLTTWNKEALKTCTANYENHYPIEKAGNWADCVRLRRPVVYNDFASSPNQKGLPEGHVKINRILSVPIIEDDQVKVIFGVGNKTDPYNKKDVLQLDLVANELNKIMKQRKAEKDLRESREKYHSLFANMTEGFFLGRVVVNKEGEPVDFIFLEVNNGFEKQSGLRQEAVVAKTVKQALPGIEQSWIETYGKVALTGKPVQFENYNQNTNRWYEVYAYSPAKGQFAATFTDISERKKAENDLRQAQAKLKEYANNLEQLVEERTKKLQDSERLAAIGATAGMVGHDIRNPLQAISSDVYLLNSDLASMPDGENKESMKESLEGIEENVQYINKIVQDLQDFARPINPAMNEVDVRKVLCEDVLFRSGIGVPENISATCRVEKENVKLITDPILLKRILCNLVTNAIQAMPDGGKLDAYAYPEAGDTVFVVQDTGVGIPDDVKDKLFTPMYTTKSKGQGLGLAVVKRMTDALGGTITYESEVGMGTKFILRLPPPKS